MVQWYQQMCVNQSEEERSFTHEEKRLERLCAASRRPSTLFSFYTSWSQGSYAVRGISEALFDSQMLHFHWWLVQFHTIIFSRNYSKMRGCAGHVVAANIGRIGVNLIRNLSVLCRCLPCAWCPPPPAHVGITVVHKAAVVSMARFPDHRHRGCSNHSFAISRPETWLHQKASLFPQCSSFGASLWGLRSP